MILVSIIIGILVLIIGGVVIFYSFEESNITAGILAIFVTLVLIIGTITFSIWYYNSTESGKREKKDWGSNTSGGIERIVTIYNINGEIIQKYEGKFDVEYNSERIKFDDEQGKRHIIYYTTGTITIDEK